MVEFRILGSVGAVHDGAAIALGGPRHRRLLAVLLLHAGQPVSVPALTDALWGERPPRSAAAMIHVRVSELRNALRAAGRGVLTHDGGYLLRLGPDELDAGRFERLAGAGAAALADGDPARARAALEAGLALWRGPALAEFADEAFARPDAIRLGELRLQAVEHRIAADLDLGRHGEVVAELRKLVTDQPLRERFWGQLMVALYRAGRQGEALQAYRAAWDHLRDQLGLEPGDTLRGLHQAILTGDPALQVGGVDVGTVPQPGHGTPPKAGRPRANPRPVTAVPAQLPADVPAFTGRADQLRRLDDLLLHTHDDHTPDDRTPDDHTPDARPADATVTVAVLSGTAGVGKTALAVHWAHRSRDRFPDGHLHVDLRGHDPGRPMAATDALARLLTALGVRPADVPLDIDERAARLRTELAGRRMLVILDNASSAEQVRPLLPGTGPCGVLVTSRDSLAGLVARDGARRVEVGLLPPADAHSLLRRLIGARAAADPTAVAALAARCARLPLALRIAAELAVSRPALPLRALASELAAPSTPPSVSSSTPTDARPRLELLDAGGDPRTAVASVFSWSIRHLPLAAARTFRLLGLHPGADFDVHAAAALTGRDLKGARRAVEALTRAHLLHETTPARYGMHDLLRAYAVRLVTPEEPDAALARLSAYYVAAAATAMDGLYPAETHRRPPAEPQDTPLPKLAGTDAARRWLDAERPNLVAVAAHRPGLSAIMYRYLGAGLTTDALALHSRAHQTADGTGDREGAAWALLGLGEAYLEMGQHDRAAGLFGRSLASFDGTGQGIGAGIAMTGLGRVELRQGNLDAAHRHLEGALTRCRSAGDPTGEARVLNVLGVVAERLGHTDRAIGHYRKALALFQRTGDLSGEAAILSNLSIAEQHADRPDRAVGHCEQALVLFRRLGDVSGEASTLDNLAGAQARLGRHAVAAEHFERAYALYREIGDREGQAWALNGLGETALATGRAGDAVACHEAALAVAAEIGAPDQQARAHAGLGHGHRASGRPDLARHHYERALGGRADLDPATARDVRAQLAALPGPR
ncbi:AfsR/SARP family transcriptional regulator [Nonomuraea sp. PA05]|uniref:AfsR/SARP family transcriptional regulator n=1 Tax=Nonomuraea sp. PA05 TaxID=2604466 RepID=UPI0016526AFA|nr:BTAD domain-containing putative transcriptional regulator [Nonomuraea sp. PA05]